MIQAVSVSQLNSYINRVMSTDPVLMNVSVRGEIANLTKHSSGHWYFSLKDKNSTLKCFLPSSRVARLRFDLDEGMEITAFGSVSVYEKGGYYSFNIKDVEASTEGVLQKAFEALKRKLDEEGLFDAERKKELPEFPRRIGVITSPTGAAVRDIITTVRRRNPLVDVLLYPVLVQGEGSADSVCHALEDINKAFPDIDVIIVGRGGGSMEDLWTFNEEPVARAVAASDIPVISAVGHETDTVITDYVADMRAATPTAAAELAVPDINYFIDRLRSCAPIKMYSALKDRVELGISRTNRLQEFCSMSLREKMNGCRNRLKLVKNDLDSCNPLLVLERGYAAVKDPGGKWISDVNDVRPGSRLEILLRNGKIIATVDSTEEVNA